jgi:hypothetical protein
MITAVSLITYFVNWYNRLLPVIRQFFLIPYKMDSKKCLWDGGLAL